MRGGGSGGGGGGGGAIPAAAEHLLDEDLTKPIKDLADKWKLLPAFLQVRDDAVHSPSRGFFPLLRA